MSRIYKPSKKKKKRKHGFISRMRSKKAVIKRRRLKGRTKLSS